MLSILKKYPVQQISYFARDGEDNQAFGIETEIEGCEA